MLLSCVHLSVRLSLYLSVTSRCSTETAKRRIANTMPHNSILTLISDLQFQSPANYGSDSYICKKSRPKVSQFERQSGKRWKEATALPSVLARLVKSTLKCVLPQIKTKEFADSRLCPRRATHDKYFGFCH